MSERVRTPVANDIIRSNVRDGLFAPLSHLFPRRRREAQGYVRHHSPVHGYLRDDLDQLRLRKLPTRAGQSQVHVRRRRCIKPTWKIVCAEAELATRASTAITSAADFMDQRDLKLGTISERPAEFLYAAKHF